MIEETKRLIAITHKKSEAVQGAHAALQGKRNFANFQLFKFAVDESGAAIKDLVHYYRENPSEKDN